MVQSEEAIQDFLTNLHKLGFTQVSKTDLWPFCVSDGSKELLGFANRLLRTLEQSAAKDSLHDSYGLRKFWTSDKCLGASLTDEHIEQDISRLEAKVSSLKNQNNILKKAASAIIDCGGRNTLKNQVGSEVMQIKAATFDLKASLKSSISKLQKQIDSGATIAICKDLIHTLAVEHENNCSIQGKQPLIISKAMYSSMLNEINKYVVYQAQDEHYSSMKADFSTESLLKRPEPSTESSLGDNPIFVENKIGSVSANTSANIMQNQKLQDSAFQLLKSETNRLNSKVFPAVLDQYSRLMVLDMVNLEREDEEECKKATKVLEEVQVLVGKLKGLVKILKLPGMTHGLLRVANHSPHRQDVKSSSNDSTTVVSPGSKRLGSAGVEPSGQELEEVYGNYMVEVSECLRKLELLMFSFSPGGTVSMKQSIPASQPCYSSESFSNSKLDQNPSAFDHIDNNLTNLRSVAFVPPNVSALTQEIIDSVGLLHPKVAEISNKI